MQMACMAVAGSDSRHSAVGNASSDNRGLTIPQGQATPIRGSKHTQQKLSTLKGEMDNNPLTDRTSVRKSTNTRAKQQHETMNRLESYRTLHPTRAKDTLSFPWSIDYAECYQRRMWTSGCVSNAALRTHAVCSHLKQTPGHWALLDVYYLACNEEHRCGTCSNTSNYTYVCELFVQ